MEYYNKINNYSLLFNPSNEDLEKIIKKQLGEMEEYNSGKKLPKAIPLVYSPNVRYVDDAITALNTDNSKGKYVHYYIKGTTEYIMYHSLNDGIWSFCSVNGNFIFASQKQK